MLRQLATDGYCPVCEPRGEGPAVTTNDVEELERALSVEECKRSLARFLQHGWHVLEPDTPLDWSWHHQTLCDHIQWMLEGWASPAQQLCQNLIINVPPGTLKSRILSVYAPAWAWMHWPGWRLLALSSNPRVAQRDARSMRELIDSKWFKEWFKPTWSIRKDQDAIGDFGNTSGGFRQSTGLNAKITGQRGDAIFVDDPNDVKDLSRIKLEQVWANWYAARNRVNDARKSIRIAIMQRVHEIDWTGRALEQGGWEHLCIPMEYEPDTHSSTIFGWEDPRTIPGEVIQPVRFTTEVLADERKGLGELGYAGQMQQRPAPAGGSMFLTEWWQYYDELPRTRNIKSPYSAPLDFDRILLSVDATFGQSPKLGQMEAQGTSRCAMVVLGARGGERYVMEVIARKMTFVEHLSAIRQLRLRWPQISKVLIETKAAGAAIINVLSAEMTGVIGVTPMGGKESRAAAIQPIVQAGNVMLLRSALWVPALLAEFEAFPRGRTDDIVDAVSQGLADLQESPHLARARMLCS